MTGMHLADARVYKILTAACTSRTYL